MPQNTAPPKMACHVRFVVERLYAGLTINELPKKSARGPTESNISQDHFDRNENFPNPVKWNSVSRGDFENCTLNTFRNSFECIRPFAGHSLSKVVPNFA